MHIPSAKTRLELENCSLFIRFVLTDDGEGDCPALILKAHSQLLKDLVARNEFALAFGELADSGPGIYSVKIYDGGEMPMFVWSIVHGEREVKAIERFRETGRCHIHLFNETAVNVASAYGVAFSFEGEPTPNMTLATDTSEDELISHGQVWIYEVMLEMTPALHAIPDPLTTLWKEAIAIYPTDAGQHAALSIVSANEGDQQEQLALWITENLEVGPIRSPQVLRNGKRRELCDILFKYPDGAFLIESKSLAVFAEPVSRTQLARRVTKAVDKGIDQLSGACRRIFAEDTILDAGGQPIDVPTDYSPHCIVLVPDLSLLEDRSDLDKTVFSQFLIEKSGYLHLLDTTELASLVHSALYWSQNTAETPIAAFDAVLMRRWNIVNDKNTINVRYFLKLKTPG